MKLPIAFLFLTSSAIACDIPPETWDKPRSAGVFLAMKQLSPCIGPFLQSEKSVLTIVHGSGDEAVLHYDEVRAWLVSLGIEPARLNEKTAAGDNLSIELEP